MSIQKGNIAQRKAIERKKMNKLGVKVVNVVSKVYLITAVLVAILSLIFHIYGTSLVVLILYGMHKLFENIFRDIKRFKERD